MADFTPGYEPFSDITISDEGTISLHGDYIKQGNYTEAKSVIDNNESMNKKGFRASLFNLIERKIQELQIYWLNKTANPGEYYSLTDPDMDWFRDQGYVFWIQPIEE